MLEINTDFSWWTQGFKLVFCLDWTFLDRLAKMVCPRNLSFKFAECTFLFVDVIPMFGK
jgi:hypothetical protein